VPAPFQSGAGRPRDGVARGGFRSRGGGCLHFETPPQYVTSNRGVLRRAPSRRGVRGERNRFGGHKRTTRAIARPAIVENLSAPDDEDNLSHLFFTRCSYKMAQRNETICHALHRCCRAFSRASVQHKRYPQPRQPTIIFRPRPNYHGQRGIPSVAWNRWVHGDRVTQAVLAPGKVHWLRALYEHVRLRS